MPGPGLQANRRLTNLLGAAAVGVSDAIQDAVTGEAGLDVSSATALVTLLDFAPSESVRFLSQVLGLTHSGAVRLVDRLVAAGYATRAAAEDERAVALTLTPRGRRVALRIRRRRALAINALLTQTNATQRGQLTRLLETLVGNLTRTRLRARASGKPSSGGALCRLCDFTACGRAQGRCPAATAAARRPA